MDSVVDRILSRYRRVVAVLEWAACGSQWTSGVRVS